MKVLIEILANVAAMLLSWGICIRINLRRGKTWKGGIRDE